MVSTRHLPAPAASSRIVLPGRGQNPLPTTNRLCDKNPCHKTSLATTKFFYDNTLSAVTNNSNSNNKSPLRQKHAFHMYGGFCRKKFVSWGDLAGHCRCRAAATRESVSWLVSKRSHDVESMRQINGLERRSLIDFDPLTNVVGHYRACEKRRH